MHIVTHQSLEELKGLENRAGTPTMILKLRALVLARQGWFAGRIAESLGKSPRTIPHAGSRHAAELLPFIEQHFGATYSLNASARFFVGPLAGSSLVASAQVVN